MQVKWSYGLQANRGNKKLTSMSAETFHVELTDESEFHCFKLVFFAKMERDAAEEERVPIEIYLHTTQAIHLLHKLSLAICEKHRQDSAELLRIKTAGPAAGQERKGSL